MANNIEEKYERTTTGLAIGWLTEYSQLQTNISNSSSSTLYI